MSKATQWLFYAVSSFIISSCVFIGMQDVSNMKTTAQTEVDRLEVQFSIHPSQIEKASELEAKIVFTNISDQPIRLNALFLSFPHVLLKVRNAEGKPVHPGSPGFPPVNDGQVGRVNLQPKESVTFTYQGSDYFGTPLPPGKYQILFRYENRPSQYQEWTGLIETEWLDFEVRRK